MAPKKTASAVIPKAEEPHGFEFGGPYVISKSSFRSSKIAEWNCGLK
jgi:hypothetical protein